MVKMIIHWSNIYNFEYISLFNVYGPDQTSNTFGVFMAQKINKFLSR